MIHARNEGESFGLSCGEFSIRNKPVITWNGSRERSHIEILGDKGIYYNNEGDLYEIMSNFWKQLITPGISQDWNAYKDYTPEKVMKIFNEVYLCE